ncbi:MAG: AAA-like domain-containing protein [Caldilineaceae bacterium]
MREFNTSGPCDPDKHYTVMRQALVAKGQALVERGRFFTIFAPRQSGKTTYFQLLFRQLRTQGYLPIWISFEGLKTLDRPVFYAALQHRLQQEFLSLGIQITREVKHQFDLELWLAEVSNQSQPLVLVIDEFEDIPPEVMSELLHVFRAMYQKREHHKLHALALVGVSTLADLVVSSASPFNVVDELRIDYFSFAEVEELINQYVTESGQPFDEAVIRAIYENTQGQPGLTCALCQYLVTEMVPAQSQPVTMAAFYPTLKHFLTERRDKNILNIVSKAREKQAFMLRVLFGNEPIPYTVDEPNINYLSAHGVVQNIDGFVQVPVPLYSKRLITAFRPPINGESNEYIVSAHESLNEFMTADGLNLHALLDKYRAYVQRRGFRAFDTKQLKEGAWHYSLDGFIHFFIQQLGGDTLVEVPSSRGRTDILVLYRHKRYIIETKVFISDLRLANGKQQLVDYLKSEGLTEGYYVVFSNKHSETDALFTSEVIDGKRVDTWIIRTNFEKPSRHRRRG